MLVRGTGISILHSKVPLPCPSFLPQFPPPAVPWTLTHPSLALCYSVSSLQAYSTRWACPFASPCTPPTCCRILHLAPAPVCLPCLSLYPVSPLPHTPGLRLVCAATLASRSQCPKHVALQLGLQLGLSLACRAGSARQDSNLCIRAHHPWVLYVYRKHLMPGLQPSRLQGAMYSPPGHVVSLLP